MILSLSVPDNLVFCSLHLHRAGWQCVLRCDESWKNDEGQSLYAMRGSGEYCETEQAAVDSAVAKIHSLVAEINREIPLRKPTQGLKSVATEVQELKDLLGL